jgi:hypothetical protein
VAKTRGGAKGGSKMEKEDLDDELNEDDAEYPEFSLGDLEKLVDEQSQRLLLEKVTVTDFSAVVAWAEEREMSIELEDCLLRGTEVRGAQIDMSFDDVSFIEKLSCANAIFAGRLRFCGTSFLEPVDFDSAVFEKDLIFEECDFDTDINLAGSHFKGNVFIENSEIDGRAVFDGAKFEGGANFRQVAFGKPASFKDALFEKEVNLWKTDFEEGVDKTGSNMDKIVGEPTSAEEEVEQGER